MKRKLHILSIIAFMLTIAAVMVACKSGPKTDSENALVLSAADTAGLAAFQSWKVQNERKYPNQYYMMGNQAIPVKNTAATARKITTVPKTSPVPASQPVTEPAKKKGWSKAAKGAVIGGTAGAVAGAIIGKKNRVLGGVIGGVVGGGVGYGIGRGMDKKDGRY
jgi:uncharacterized protein YcfJ